MSNTVIQIKYSNATSTPASLNVGELAYSFTSGKLFTGNSTNAVLTIGGKYYTDLMDGATSANTVSTIVKRDSLGGFSATHVYASLYGNANTATRLATPRFINVTGDVDAQAVSFDGTANADITFELTNTGVTAGTYGGTTNIPTFVVDADGRVTSAANVAISTTLSIAGDTGTDSVALNGGTLTFEGGDGITSTVTDDKVSLAVDNTVFRSSGGTISGDLAVTGNLVISGTTITQDVTTVQTEDSLLKLAANNVSDAIDIGFYGQYNDGATKFAGLVRDATDGNFKLFVGETTDPTTNTVSYDSSNRATLDANLTGGTVSGLSSDISVSDGGTGVSTFTAGQILVGNGTGALAQKSNVTQTATGSLAVANTITALSFDAQTGGITAYTSQAIAISTDQVTSGTLPIARGGTNQTSFTNGLVAFNGSSLATLPNTTYTQTGTLGAANTISSLTVDAYGRTTAATISPIAIDASQVTSGTLVTARGGTGLSSFTDKGVFYASSTSAMSQVSSSTEGHLLTINASGAPTFAHLSGGTF